MKALWILLVSFALGLVLSGLASAQDVAIAPASNNWTYYRHASTPTEGFLRGQAAVVQAFGDAAYYDSLSAVNYQEAYRRSLENARLYTQVYYERKAMKYQFNERYKEKPPTAEKLKLMSEMSRPNRLEADEFDPKTGKLTWPHILRMQQYDAIRDQVDRVMVSRTETNSGDGSPSHREIRQLVDAMKLLLKENMDQVTPQQYGFAKMFLISLEYEAQLPIRAEVPAPVPTVAVPPVVQPVSVTPPKA